MPAAADRVSARTWTAVIGATIGAFMAILNIQLVGAALGDIRAGLGASPDDGAWVVTAYLVAEIVVIPLSSWLSRAFSLRRYLIANATLFLVFSVACAFAQDLGQMIVLRILQGLTGGVLIPMAFTLNMTLLPPSRQPTGLAAFSLAATFAPAVGPTVGGWLSATFGWHAVFLLNLAPGGLMLALLWVSLERQPMRLDLLRQGDWLGIVSMAIGLGALQVVLEEGGREDWFDSPFITGLAAVAVAALALFVRTELRSSRPLLNLRLLARRNFGAGVTAMMLVGAVSYGSTFVLPAYLARVQGYDAQQIGEALAWSALPQLMLIPLMPRLMRLVDARVLMVLGFALVASSSFMLVGLDAGVAADQLLLPNVVRAVGQALAMTPLTVLATGGLDKADAGSASALLNVMRNMGGAVGIAGLQTFLVERERFHVDVIGQSVSMFDEETRLYLGGLARRLVEQGVVDPSVAWHKAVGIVAGMVREQAFVMAVGDAFWLLGSALVLALTAALLLKKPAVSSSAAAAD
ncbi:MAG: multidrug efflux MFS transporter [Reyranella sp.]|nr:multidrug efflux MFS transporter [Reyranella sp.]